MKGVTSMSPVATTVPSSEMGESFSYDADFTGPVKKRSCTDVVCLFLFIAYIAGWIVVAGFAFTHGNPKVLINPTDSYGNICGMYDHKNKPYLYFFDLTKCANPKVLLNGCPTPQVCVSQCPNETYFVDPSMTSEADKEKLICSQKANLHLPISDLIEKNQCAGFYLKSTPLAQRCIPDMFLLNAKGAILDQNNATIKNEKGEDLLAKTVDMASRILAEFLDAKNIGEKIFSDFRTAWKEMLLGLFICMLACLIWVFLMRWFAGIMVWFSILAVTGFSGFAFYFSVKKYIEMKNNPESESQMRFTTNLKSYLAMKNTWLAFAIISGLVLLLMFVILIFLRKRLLIAIALIKEASRAVSSMLSSLLFPILPYIIHVAILSFWAAVALFIASSGRAKYVVQDAPTDAPVKNGTVCFPDTFNVSHAKCRFLSYGNDNNMYGGQIYNLFGMLWAVFFIIGLGELSIAGAFASYYWTLDKSRNLPYCAIGTGFYRCLRYHLGSVALGSVLIAAVKMIRICLEYIDRKCKKYDNKITRGILCCLKCCFWCLDNLIRFISKNAYIMIAVYGENFCSSAKTAFMLLLRNAVRVIVLDQVTDFLLFIGKLAIVGAAAAGSFMVFTSKVKGLDNYVPILNYNLLPVIVITVGAYVIASIFFNVYSMAIDTLFLCFLEDLERNDGSPSKPYYMSKELMKILDKSNKFREPKD